MGDPLNVRLGRLLDIISRHPQDVRLRRPWDNQIGSLWNILWKLEGDVLGMSWGPIFAGWKDRDQTKENKRQKDLKSNLIVNLLELILTKKILMLTMGLKNINIY